jgi:DMSO/TMAO reductase YedYZ molybdopterin-dependent catalytic subunit
MVGGFGRLAEAAGVGLTPGVPEGVASYATMATLPGKKPLIELSDRPPNYETPLEYLRTPITPNDEFFIRYHLTDIPEVKAEGYKIAVGGDGANGTAEITLDDLKKMPAVEVVAVNQCSGNRRGLSKPHVQGVEWGYGAMGCARWKGAKLKDILDKAGLKKEAIEVAFDGADGPSVQGTPDFIKSIPAWKAIEESTIVAYEMNGQPLPHLNGFPARLVVPGWTRLAEASHQNQRATSRKASSDEPAYRIARQIPVRALSPGTAVNTHHEIVVNSPGHQPPRRRQGESGQTVGQRPDGRRLWYPYGTGLDRWRQDGRAARWVRI